MAKIKLGIIGIGNMGTGHLCNWQDGLMPEIDVVAVADRNEARRTWAQEHLSGVQVFCEGSELSTPATVSSTFMFSYCICRRPEIFIDFVDFSFADTCTAFLETPSASARVMTPFATRRSSVALS